MKQKDQTPYVVQLFQNLETTLSIISIDYKKKGYKKTNILYISFTNLCRLLNVASTTCN